MTKDDVLGALPKLSQPDLLTVQAALNHLLGGATVAPEPMAGAAGQALFDALVTALGLTMAYSAYSPTAAAQFNKRVPQVLEFFNEEFKGWDKNRVLQTAFLRMMFGLLVDDLKAKGMNPTVGMTVTNLPRLRAVFENAFPGYLECGMGAMIMNNLKKA